MSEPATVQEIYDSDPSDKFAALGPDPSADAAFDAVDTDQSGTISRAEFRPVWEYGRQQEREKTKALAENKTLKSMVVLLILAVLIIIGVTSGVSALPTLPFDRASLPTVSHRALPPFAHRHHCIPSPPTPQPLPS